MRGLSLVAASGGPSSSRCAGLSLSRPPLLRSTGSKCAGSVVVAHGPSCSMACGILPDQGSNPCPLHWQADSQPLRHQGSPRDFFLPLFHGTQGRGFRAPPKRTPETGASRGYQRGHWRRAGDAKAAAVATKKPVCEHRSLSTPPLPGAGAACHCQAPVIQGQLPWENAWRASGGCNITPASASASSPRLLRTTPSPWPE